MPNESSRKPKGNHSSSAPRAASASRGGSAEHRRPTGRGTARPDSGAASAAGKSGRPLRDKATGRSGNEERPSRSRDTGKAPQKRSHGQADPYAERSRPSGARAGSAGGRSGSAGGRFRAADDRSGSAGGRSGSGGDDFRAAGGRSGSAGGRFRAADDRSGSASGRSGSGSDDFRAASGRSGSAGERTRSASGHSRPSGQRSGRQEQFTEGRGQRSQNAARPAGSGRPAASARPERNLPRAAAPVETEYGSDLRPEGKAVRQAKAELYPKAEFARREGMLEGLPAVMVVNRSLKQYPHKKDFPWCLRLVVAYRADAESGLPLAKEEQVLETFEQNLFGLLRKNVNGHYVGHTSWSGSREFVFYLDDGGDAEEPLESFSEAQKRELEFAIEDDPKWQHCAHYFDYRD